MFVFNTLLMTAANVESNTAKRDAVKDLATLKELKWCAAGCLGGILPFIVMDAILVADYADVISYDTFNTFNPVTLDECILILFGVSAILPTGYAVLHSPIPPADRFLGKSSAYVNAYTKAYKKQAKGQRIFMSASGCLGGMIVGVCTVTALAGHGNVGE